MSVNVSMSKSMSLQHTTQAGVGLAASGSLRLPCGTRRQRPA